MAHFKLDFSKFKKIAATPHMTTLQHPEGHTINVAHHLLPPKVRGDLHALPLYSPEHEAHEKIDAPLKSLHMAKGGKVKKAAKKEVDENEDEKDSESLGDDSYHFAEGGAAQDDPQASPTINVNVSGQQPNQLPPVPEGMGLLGRGGGQNPFGNAISQDTLNAPDESKLPYGISQEDVKNAQAAKQDDQIHAGQAAPEAAEDEGESGQEAAAKPTVNVSGAVGEPKPESINDAVTKAMNDPYGVNTLTDYIKHGYDQQVEGIKKQAVAEGALGLAQQKLLEKQASDQAAQAKTYQDHLGTLNDERQKFQDDIKNAHIDPNRYFANMGTGQKISSAIGMILGGLGGALTGQGNPAMSFINNQIENDVRSQQADLGKKENLLSANMKQFGNLADATNMTKVMMMDSVKNQLMAQAAQANTPLAKARAMQQIGAIDQQIAPMMSQTAARRTILTGAGNNKVNPSQFIRMMVPEKEQEPMFKELGEAQMMMKQKDNILGAFDKIAKINTLPKNLMSPIQVPRQVQALKGPIVAALSKETAGRFTEQDAQLLDSLFTKVGNNPDTNRVLRAQMMKLIGEKMNFPHLAAYPQVFGNLSTGGNRQSIREGAPIAPGQ